MVGSAHACAAPICALILTACQSAPPPTLHPLATTLSADASRLLAGCQMTSGAFELQVVCLDDTVIARQSQPAALEANWLAVAVGEAHARGGELHWSDQRLATIDGPRPLRLATYVGPDCADLGFLAGVSLPRGELRDDLWCGAPTTIGVTRCEAILAALLQTSTTRTAAPTPTTPTTSTTSTTPTTSTTTSPALAAPPDVAGGAALQGRARSLPTTCRIARQEPRAGLYPCEGHSLAWRVVEDMDRAAEEDAALFASLPADEDPVRLPCRLAYETAVCRGTALVVVGTAFVDGEPIRARCLARDMGLYVRQWRSCRTLLGGTW